MTYFASVFETGLAEPGLDNYICPLRTALAELEKIAGANASQVTRRELSLGDRDAVTKWCSSIFTESTIHALIVNNGNSPVALPVGMFARYPHTGFVPDVVHVDDELIDQNGDYYVVKACEKNWFLNKFNGYVCNLVLRETLEDTPASSGTWHLDSESLKTDVRYRTSIWLDTYLSSATITEDNASTAADYVVMFAMPRYYLLREFITNELDVIVYVAEADSQPIYAADKKPYVFNETVTLQICAINKTGITAVNLLEKMEQAIRKVATDHPIGSVRQISSSKPSNEDLGGFVLWSKTLTLEYERPNDDYTPTYPTITYGDNQASTYTFPNAVTIRYRDPDSGDAYLLPPGRIGEITQILGMENFEVELTCNLNINPAALTWKRPQTTTPKTDYIPEQVFREIKFGGKTDSDQEYQNLNLGNGTVIPVRLINISVDSSGDEKLLSLTFKRYSATDGSLGTYLNWYGIGTP